MRIVLLISFAGVFFAGCSTGVGARHIQPVAINDGISDPLECPATIIVPVYVGTVPKQWRKKVQESAASLGNILASEEFAVRCGSLRLTRRNGKSVTEVCRQLSCAGEIAPTVSFYRDPESRFIAYERGGALFVNTAKDAAGKPGNLAHEVTHILGYTHFSNKRFLGTSSVPYRIGSLVRELVNAAEQ